MVYKLSATLQAHTQDVRALATPTADWVFSASRDSTAIAWRRAEDGKSFDIAATYKPGNYFINAIAYLPPTPDAPLGYVITGGQDAIINVFVLGSPSAEPSYSLLGHTSNICALATSADGTIVSGSWDSTARVWRGFQEMFVLKGHTLSVWAVLVVDVAQTLTASADKTIRLWEQAKQVKQYTGHTDAVRGLVLVPDIGFASCSNDSEIRVWTLGGDLVYTLPGHTSFVYSLALLPSGDIVSGGEDRSARVWKDGECAQTIVHPAISVWTVSSMPNGDIVTGCSDGIIRIYSTAEERWVSEEDLKKYDELISMQAISSQQVGNVNKEQLPGPEALNQPGKKDGFVKMIRDGDNVDAYQWEAEQNKWTKIGTVVDAVGSGRQQLYEGKEYDYVFDVDIQDGAPALKLPYNASENPYQAAHRFLTRNELPLSYLDQVAKFIEQNTAAVQLGAPSNQYVDPYTGGSRHIEPEVGAQVGGVGQYVDPYTGSNRYVPPSDTGPRDVGAGNVDPYTGARRPKSVLPVLSPQNFKSANLPAMEKKLRELDAEEPDPAQKITEDEWEVLTKTCAALQAAAGGDAASAVCEATWLETVLQIIARWPAEKIYPLLDLIRTIFAYSPSILKTNDIRAATFAQLLNAAEINQPWPAEGEQAPKHRQTNIVLFIRCMANALQLSAQGFETGMGSWTNQCLEALHSVPQREWNVKSLVPLATLLFNYSIVFHIKSVDQDTGILVLDLLSEVLVHPSADGEAQYRALVGAGNVLSSKSRPKVGKKGVELLKQTSALGKRTTESRTKELVKEVQSVIV